MSGLVGFNLGIETMQLLVVVATVPSVVLLSRTPAYSYLRIVGGVFAAIASFGWLIGRLFDLHTPVDAVVGTLADGGAFIAIALFLASLACWSWNDLIYESGFPNALSRAKTEEQASKQLAQAD